MTTKATFTFSPRLLDHLGVAAYNSIQKSLAELCANAYDADAKVVEIDLPDAIEGQSVIRIRDNGIGMTAADIRDKFLFVGRNKREAGQKTAGGRLLIGSKGIGKLAGFGIANSLTIITNRNAQQSKIVIDRKGLDDLTTFANSEFDIVTSDTAAKNGTQLILSTLRTDITLPDVTSVRRYLYRHLPCSSDFVVRINNVECTPEDLEGEKSTFDENVPGLGNIKGYYVLAKSRQAKPGFAVRVRGRLVQDSSLFGLDTKAHGYFTAERIVGEITSDIFDPENPEMGSLDLINTTRDGFIEDSEKVRNFNLWVSNFLKQIVRGVEEGETKKRTDALLAMPEIKGRLEKMPPHIRAVATRIVRALVVKLKSSDPNDTKDLVEWVLRYYESNTLRELVSAILSADVSDADKLAELVKSWGVAQVSRVTELIRSQIDIIQKLEELIATPKSKEMDLHKIIAENLWMVREGLELWSSDKPLKKVLEGHLDKVYKSKEKLRPDLICKSRDENSAVILEFKKPSEKIEMAHVTQVLEYETIIKKHRPALTYTLYVVGHEYRPEVRDAQSRLAQGGINLCSYTDVLQRARLRFEKILAIVEGE